MANSRLGVIEIILGIFLPPVAVLLRRGLGGAFLLNIILCLFGWLPGVIHAFWSMTR